MRSTTAVAVWSGGLAGTGTVDCPSIRSDISVPANLDGRGVGTNTEDLLVSAAATCFAITLGHALTRRGLPFDGLRVRSTGHFQFQQGLRFARLHHDVDVVAPKAQSLIEREAMLRVLAEVDKACLVSRAVVGNVAVAVTGAVLAC